MKNTDGVQWRTNNFNWRIIVHNQLVFSCLIIHLPSCEFEPHSWRGVLDTTLCDSVCQRLATGQWFSPDTPVSSTNKTEILLKVVKHNKPTNLFIYHTIVPSMFILPLL